MKFNAMRFKHGKFAIQCETRQEAKSLLNHLKKIHSIQFGTTFKEYLDKYSTICNCFAYDDTYMYLCLGSEKAVKHHINNNTKIVEYNNVKWNKILR